MDAARFEAGLGDDLTLPGSDLTVLVPNATVERILCDTDVTTIITRPLTSTDADQTDAATAHTPAAAMATAAAADAPACGPERCPRRLGDLLLEASREVHYVGRTQRVVPPRLRRALEARDRHCAFPGCRASVHRCHAHHVNERERDGRTDLDTMPSSACVISTPSTTAAGASPAPRGSHRAGPGPL